MKSLLCVWKAGRIWFVLMPINSISPNAGRLYRVVVLRRNLFAMACIVWKVDVREEDIIVIHDGIRPMIDDTVLSDVIVTCRKYGNAVSSLPYNEQIFRTEDGETSREYIPRETLRRVSTPQAYYFGRLDRAYHEAFEKEIGIHGSAYTNTMMVDLGEKLHLQLDQIKI